MATWKVAAALAAGCTAILKPSELASITCLELGEACGEVGLPPGVLNILTGLEPEAGAPLAAHPHVDKIAFTGSSATGSKIMTAAAELVKVCSESTVQLLLSLLCNQFTLNFYLALKTNAMPYMYLNR